MGEVVYINNAERGEAHLSGEAICSACDKEWTAVAPVGTKELECPDCKTMKGLFKHHLAPVTPKVWTCNCGCRLFFVLKNQIQCCECGVTTNSEDIE
jgi:hypothetical protein